MNKFRGFIFASILICFSNNFALAKDQDRVLKAKEYIEYRDKCFDIFDDAKNNLSLIQSKKNIWQEVCSLAVKYGEENFSNSLNLPEIYEILAWNTRNLNSNSLKDEKDNILQAENYYLKAKNKYQYFADNNISSNRIGWIIKIGKINRNLSALLKEIDIKKSYYYIEQSLDYLLNAKSIDQSEEKQYNKDVYGWDEDYQDKISKLYFNYSGYLAYLYKNNKERFKAKNVYDQILPNNNCKNYEGWADCISKLAQKADLYQVLGFNRESKNMYSYIFSVIDDYGLNDKNSPNYNFTDYCVMMRVASKNNINNAKEKYSSTCKSHVKSELNSNDLINLARDYQEERNFREAYNYAYDASQKLLKIYPRESQKVIETYLLMGEILLNSGNFRLAKDIFQIEFGYIYKNNYLITEDLTRYKMFYFASLLGTAENEKELINSLFLLKDIIADDKESLIKYSARMPLKERLTLLSSETYQKSDNLILSLRGNFVDWNLNRNLDENTLLTEQVISEINKVSLISRLNRKGLLEQIERNQAFLVKADDKYKLLNQKLNYLYEQLLIEDNAPQSFQTIQQKIKIIEKQLFSKLPSFNEGFVDEKYIFDALPADSILIDIKKFKPYVYTSKGYDYGDYIYSALVVEKNGRIVEVELGESKNLDDSIKALLINIEQGNDYAQNLRNIYKLFLKPLEKYLVNNSEIFLSLDSYLNYIPINLLKNPNNNSYYHEQFDLKLISSPRELIQLMSLDNNRLQNSSINKPVVFANPSFNLLLKKIKDPNQDSLYTNNLLRSSENCRDSWNQLPSTKNEGQEIKKIIDAKLFMGDEASEDKIKNLDYSPYILHIATHGFYCSKDTEINNPLLQSGIVLAGANNKKNGDTQNGILTALEFTQLDLSNTELVVLSSCESAIGKDEVGEGILGLRRALAVAGARSSILSLWKVDDEATSKFMEVFYKKLKKNLYLKEALKETQKEFRNGIVKSNLPGIDWSDPYYWAAFQLSGDWRAIKIN